MRDRDKSYAVVQLTDLHLLSEADGRLLGVDTAATLEAALDATLRPGRVDAVVVTGDIAHDGAPETYRRAAAMLSRYHRGPTIWLPGNHDIEASMQAVLPRANDVVLGRWQLLAIDTHVDGQEGGHVGAVELDRIAHELSRSSAQDIVAFGHHPCVPVGTPWLDSGRIDDAQALLELLAQDGRIRAYAFGHIHHGGSYSGAAWPIWSTPATCFEFAQGGARFGVETMTPGSRRFELGANGSLESVVVRAERPLVAPDMTQFRK